MLLTVLSLATAPVVDAVEIAEAEKLYQQGQYDKALEAAQEAIKDSTYVERWWRLAVDVHTTRGEHEQAIKALNSALLRFRTSIALRLRGFHLLQAAGKQAEADDMLDQINGLVRGRAWLYSDAENYITQGRTALLMGADARQVLELFYDRALKANPNLAEGYLASGELALSKGDFAVAADVFQRGLKQHPEHPDLLLGLAKAFAESDGQRTQAAVAACLKHNPKHVPAMLFVAEHMIDREQLEGAVQQLSEALKVHGGHPQAWAFRAVIAHVRGDYSMEAKLREKALAAWKSNPLVDHTIGRKLSQKYRFTEGAAYQRRALAADKDYLPAKLQLSQDLLRLGEVEEGWKLANEVHEKDGYDVVAYNLVTLQEKLAKFKSIEDEHFIVRMERHEADVYGKRVLALLNEARESLDKRYGLKQEGRVTVEVFPDQRDFAIRTFGLPGGAGFLGVCFGNVITANSPATQENPSNWKVVLWHEYCHVVTLRATRNRMPRWLSEGISVYEELQRDPTWGQRMNPIYRRMVLEGGLTPVGELSGAFLRPPSGVHLQFAYYQSNLVVEYLVKTYGLDKLKALLADLAKGVLINPAIEKHFAPIDKIEAGFAAFAKKRANDMAPKAVWRINAKPSDAGEAPPNVAPNAPPNDAPTDVTPAERLARDRAMQEQLKQADIPELESLLKQHPNYYPAMQWLARRYVQAKQWGEAIKLIDAIAALHPTAEGEESPYRLKAFVHRQRKDPKGEREAWQRVVAIESDAIDATTRLLSDAIDRKAWRDAITHAEQTLAINPMHKPSHQAIATAAEHLGDRTRAIDALQTLTHLKPHDPAGLHYRLASLLHASDSLLAKRHVLMALEQAPRYRDAQRLLLKIVASEPTAPPKQEPGEPATAAPPIEPTKPATPSALPASPALPKPPGKGEARP